MTWEKGCRRHLLKEVAEQLPAASGAEGETHMRAFCQQLPFAALRLLYSSCKCVAYNYLIVRGDFIRRG
jgi:hypothetical protein